MVKKVEKPVEHKTTAINWTSKYRPTKLDDIVGQPGVISEIKGWIKRNEFPHTIGIFGPYGTGKCLVGNSLVPTSKGLFTLEELWNQSNQYINKNGFRNIRNKGLKVVSTKGESLIDKTFCTEGKTRVITTKTGDIVEGLEEHKLLSFTKDGNVDFRCLGEIKNGDWIVKSVGSYLFNNEIPDVYVDVSFESKFHKGRLQTDVIIPKKLNLELARVFGLMVAEGSGVSRFHNNDPEVLSLFMKDIYTCFQASRSIENTDTTRSAKNIGVGRIIGDFLSKHISIGKSATKYVPVCILQAPKEYQVAFLQALFEGDGTIYGKPPKGSVHLEYTTISKALALQVKAMLENFGVHVTYRPFNTWASNGSPKQKSKKGYHLEIFGYDIITFKKEIGFLCSKKSEKLENYTRHLLDNNDFNMQIFGPFNKVPGSDFYERFYNRIKFLAEKTRRPEENRGRGIPNYYSACNVLPLFDNTTKNIRCGRLTRYRLKQDLKCLEKFVSNKTLLSEVIRKDEELGEIISVFKNILNYDWVKVKSSRASNKIKPVFDISVPGTQSYTVNGIMSHNSTVARILACTINKAASVESCSDIREVNVGTSRGIDDAREIAASANLRPFISAFRIFIMEEFHALTTAGTTSLLRPIEDPPSSSIFMIVTNQPERINKGILGRCSKLYLKTVEPVKLVPYLTKIAKSEGKTFNEKVFLKIAEFSGGQPREAVSILQSFVNILEGDPSTSKKDALLQACKEIAAVSDETRAINMLVALYNNDEHGVIKGIIEDPDVHGVIAKMLELHRYVFDMYSGSKTYHTPMRQEMLKKIGRPPLKKIVYMQNGLVECKKEMMQATVRDDYIALGILCDLVE